MCHVRRRFQRLAHFDNDALPEARSPRLRTPPIHSFSGRLIVLYFSNTNATGVVVAVKPHLELRRKYTKFGGRCQFRSLAMLMYPVRRCFWMMQDQNTRGTSFTLAPAFPAARLSEPGCVWDPSVSRSPDTQERTRTHPGRHTAPVTVTFACSNADIINAPPKRRLKSMAPILKHVTNNTRELPNITCWGWRGELQRDKRIVGSLGNSFPSKEDTIPASERDGVSTQHFLA